MSLLDEQKECGDTNKDLSEQFRQHVSERVKLYEASMKGSGSESPAKISIKKNNNIRHVVPAGVLIVFFTLYLTTTAIQFKYVNYVHPEDKRNSDFDNTFDDEEMQAQETTKRIKILEKLLEYKDLCTELEVFTKDLRWVNEIMEKANQLKEIDTECEQITEESEIKSLDVENGENHDQKESKHKEKPTEMVESQHTNRDKSKIAPQNGKRRSNKALALKNNQINNNNAENNNSTASNNNNKKDQSTAKKSNTAEPIIYMFALVFIYLLLKAASDINQHYKSQNKGDKRLRRCSLQSYAQTHKQDRRASKDSSSRKSKKESLLEMRSQSVDRFNDTAMKKSEILSNLRKFTSFDEHNRLANIQRRVHGLPLQPSRETQNCGESSCNPLESTPPKISGRRCSVPVSLSFQRPNVKVVTLPISNLTRRTSLSGAHIGLETNLIDHGQDTPFHEVKRRVRMINRH